MVHLLVDNLCKFLYCFWYLHSLLSVWILRFVTSSMHCIATFKQWIDAIFNWTQVFIADIGDLLAIIVHILKGNRDNFKVQTFCLSKFTHETNMRIPDRVNWWRHVLFNSIPSHPIQSLFVGKSFRQNYVRAHLLDRFIEVDSLLTAVAFISSRLSHACSIHFVRFSHFCARVFFLLSLGIPSIRSSYILIKC